METRSIKEKNGTYNIVQETFPVLEMTCAACAISVESMLKAAPGVKDATVNFANQTAWVEYDQAITKPIDLQKSVQSIGYDLVVDSEDPQTVQKEALHNYYTAIKHRTIWSSILALPVVVIGMFFMNLPYGNYISLILTAPVVFWFGRNFYINAFKQARHGKANMDTLVAISTGVAFAFSAFNTFFPEFWHVRGIHPHVYYEAAAVVIAFISLGKLLEERAKANTTSAIRKLMGLQPKTVKIIVGGIENQIPISSVKVGDVIVIRPGERIPVDGVVTEGVSFVNESMISGEPMAVEKTMGQKVFAGTVNQKGSFQFHTQQVGSETVLAHIIKLVQQAQGSKAPVQKLVDRIAGVFVPVVIGISILTFVMWIMVGGENAFTHALLTSVTVLVIACPCALGLATPTAIMVGVGKGAENNILIKDAESLELAHRVNAVILDKTGTITEGKPVVTDLIWEVPDDDIDDLRNVLFSLESRSEHPLGEAIVKKLIHDGAAAIALDDFESLTGRGVRGRLAHVEYAVGNRKLVDDKNINLSPQLFSIASQLQSESKTVVYFTRGESVISILAIADTIKPSAKEAIESLQQRGIEVYMLTGDNTQTAKAVSDQVGIKIFRAEVMPGDKAAFVTTLQKKGKIVAMVGDGINDSQALAQADISIAMGKGSDIAMDVAKITLITSDLRSIAKAFNLSTRTVKGIRQNLFWAFIYNTLGIPLAAGILYPVNGYLLDPMIASAAMALSSVSVVSNSLRLRTLKL